MVSMVHALNTKFIVLFFLSSLIVLVLFLVPELPSLSTAQTNSQDNTLTDSDAMTYYSNPSNYINKNVNFTGKILTLLPPASGTLGLQMYQAGDTNRNTIVIYATPIQLSKDDCVRVTGITQPVTEYQNTFGATLSAAAIEADSINEIDCSESIEPAKKIVNVEQTQEKNTIKITLHKVEFSDKNTRAYLTVENTDPLEDIIFYDFNSRAIQGKSQFITTNSYDVDYPKIESTIPAGIEENGVVLFEPLDPTESEAQFRFEVRDKSYNNLRFIFDVILSPLEFYDKALAIDPNDMSALVNKGLALYNLGSNTEAIKLYDKALAIDPDNIVVLNNKGISLASLGNYTGAIELYDIVLAIDPNDMSALINKGFALENLGNYTGAIAMYDKALTMDPDNAAILDLKALALQSR